MIEKHVPGMQPDRLARNLILAVVYFALLPLLLPIVPFYTAFAIGTDRNDIKQDIRVTRLSNVPGLTLPGWKGAFVAFLYTMIFVLAFFLIPAPL